MSGFLERDHAERGEKAMGGQEVGRRRTGKVLARREWGISLVGASSLESGSMGWASVGPQM